jgi:hypothetical protein
MHVRSAISYHQPTKWRAAQRSRESPLLCLHARCMFIAADGPGMHAPSRRMDRPARSNLAETASLRPSVTLVPRVAGTTPLSTSAPLPAGTPTHRAASQRRSTPAEILRWRSISFGRSKSRAAKSLATLQHPSVQRNDNSMIPTAADGSHWIKARVIADVEGYVCILVCRASAGFSLKLSACRLMNDPTS